MMSVARKLLLLCVCACAAVAAVRAQQPATAAGLLDAGDLPEFFDESGLELLANATTNGRRLAQKQPALASPCYWDHNTCLPDAKTWFTTDSGQPSSVVHRALMMSVERTNRCAKMTNRQACMADQDHRCFWISQQQGGAQCLNADRFEVDYIYNKLFEVSLDTIPTSLACPNTRLREFVRCWSHPAPVLCNELPGCTPLRVPQYSFTRCVPKWYASSSQQQRQFFRDAAARLDESVAGNCEGACFLRQASVCKQQRSGSACTRYNFCRWSNSQQTCFRQVWEVSRSWVDRDVDELQRTCMAINSQSACESQPKVALKQKGKWANWKVSPQRATCSINQVA